MEPISYKEIKYNLEIMENTIKKGNARHIDVGFIEIFANAIEELEKSHPKKKLNERLYRAHDAILQSVPRPPVGNLVRIEEAFSGYTPGFTKTGLDALDPHFQIKKIVGDGHCMFRAIGQGIIDAHLEDIDIDQELLSEESATDRLVEFLRKLACSRMQESDNEVLQSIISPEYIRDMRDMQKKRHGGEPELIALSEALNLDIRILDAVVIGKGEKSVESYVNTEKGPRTIFLLLTPAHYDILYPTF